MTGHRGRRGGYAYAPRGRRARRGAVRAAILVLLGEEPRNGYALMQEIETRSEGTWRPSPGSIYPALAMMEDEGLIRSVGSDDQRAYELTDAGRKVLEERGDAGAPWEEADQGVGDEVLDLARTMRQVGMAVGPARPGGIGRADQAGQAGPGRRPPCALRAAGRGPRGRGLSHADAARRPRREGERVNFRNRGSRNLARSRAVNDLV